MAWADGFPRSAEIRRDPGSLVSAMGVTYLAAELLTSLFHRALPGHFSGRAGLRRFVQRYPVKVPLGVAFGLAILAVVLW